jgi:hypothetical protein
VCAACLCLAGAPGGGHEGVGAAEQQHADGAAPRGRRLRHGSAALRYAARYAFSRNMLYAMAPAAAPSAAPARSEAFTAARSAALSV